MGPKKLAKQDPTSSEVGPAPQDKEEKVWIFDGQRYPLSVLEEQLTKLKLLWHFQGVSSRSWERDGTTPNIVGTEGTVWHCDISEFVTDEFLDGRLRAYENEYRESHMDDRKHEYITEMFDTLMEDEILSNLFFLQPVVDDGDDDEDEVEKRYVPSSDLISSWPPDFESYGSDYLHVEPPVPADILAEAHKLAKTGHYQPSDSWSWDLNKKTTMTILHKYHGHGQKDLAYEIVLNEAKKHRTTWTKLEEGPLKEGPLGKDQELREQWIGMAFKVVREEEWIGNSSILELVVDLAKQQSSRKQELRAIFNKQLSTAATLQDAVSAVRSLEYTLLLPLDTYRDLAVRWISRVNWSYSLETNKTIVFIRRCYPGGDKAIAAYWLKNSLAPWDIDRIVELDPSLDQPTLYFTALESYEPEIQNCCCLRDESQTESYYDRMQCTPDKPCLHCRFRSRAKDVLLAEDSRRFDVKLSDVVEAAKAKIRQQRENPQALHCGDRDDSPWYFRCSSAKEREKERKREMFSYEFTGGEFTARWRQRSFATSERVNEQLKHIQKLITATENEEERMRLAKIATRDVLQGIPEIKGWHCFRSLDHWKDLVCFLHQPLEYPCNNCPDFRCNSSESECLTRSAFPAGTFCTMSEISSQFLKRLRTPSSLLTDIEQEHPWDYRKEAPAEVHKKNAKYVAEELGATWDAVVDALTASFTGFGVAWRWLIKDFPEKEEAMVDRVLKQWLDTTDVTQQEEEEAPICTCRHHEAIKFLLKKRPYRRNSIVTAVYNSCSHECSWPWILLMSEIAPEIDIASRIIGSSWKQSKEFAGYEGRGRYNRIDRAIALSPSGTISDELHRQAVANILEIMPMISSHAFEKYMRWILIDPRSSQDPEVREQLIERCRECVSGLSPKVARFICKLDPSEGTVAAAMKVCVDAILLKEDYTYRDRSGRGIDTRIRETLEQPFFPLESVGKLVGEQLINLLFQNWRETKGSAFTYGSEPLLKVHLTRLFRCFPRALPSAVIAVLTSLFHHPTCADLLKHLFQFIRQGDGCYNQVNLFSNRLAVQLLKEHRQILEESKCERLSWEVEGILRAFDRCANEATLLRQIQYRIFDERDEQRSLSAPRLYLPIEVCAQIVSFRHTWIPKPLWLFSAIPTDVGEEEVVDDV